MQIRKQLQTSVKKGKFAKYSVETQEASPPHVHAVVILTSITLSCCRVCPGIAADSSKNCRISI